LGWAAGIDRRAGGIVALEHRREQIGDVAVMAGVAVVAGELDLAAGEELVEAAAVGCVAEAEQDPRGDVPGGEATPQQGQRRDPYPPAHQNRSARPNCINFSTWRIEKLMQFAGG
jgi:hypothetical protein